MDKVKAKSEKWKRNLGARMGAVTSFVAVLLLLVSAVGGCGKSDEGISGESSGKAVNGTGGGLVSKNDGVAGTSTAQKTAPTDTLVVKGLYMGQPGDDALEACKELVGSSENLVVVDFRNGIEREKDEATKAAEKKAYEDSVKNAEADVNRFLEWSPVSQPWFKYDPSRMNCEKDDHRDKEDYRPYLGPKNRSVKIPGVTTITSAKAALAGIYGYQMEWMLPGKRNVGKQKDAHEPELHIVGRFEIPANKFGHDNVYKHWKKNVQEGAKTELYSKGFQIPKQYEGRPCFRLVLQDVNGKPVEKKKLAQELVLSERCSQFFEAFNSKQEKLEAAEKEVDAFLEWIEMGERSGDSVYVKVFDPSDIRTDDEKRRERSELMYKMRENKMREKKELALKELALRKQVTQLSAKIKKVKGEKFQKLNEQYVAKKKEWEALKKTIEDKEGKKKSVVKASNPTTTKKRINSKILESALEGRRYGDTDRFPDTMADLACNCKVMVEWAALVVPADKVTEIIEAFVIPQKDFTGASEFVKEMDDKLGKWSESRSGNDGSRKKLFFEKELVDLHSHLWFRLVLKDTNGVEVAKEEVVKNWLAARGEFPPSDKLILAKKNLIQVSVKKKGVREDKLPGLVFVWIDDAGKVKEVYFNGDGMDRIFGELPVEEFAQKLVNNYSGIPDLRVERLRDSLDQYGSIATTTWIYKDSKGYQVKLFECAFITSNGKRFNSDKNLNLEVAYYLTAAGKAPNKFFVISAIKPEAPRKFD